MDWHSRFLQQAAWTRDLRTYLFERAGLKQVKSILEVGCGTGAILADLATPAIVHGLDLDPDRLREVRMHAPFATPVCGDALALPYPAFYFDITFCHYLLLWVGNPLKALFEMKRVTRHGGAVLAMAEPDYDSRLDKPDVLAPLGRWQAEALRRQGANPSLGSRIGSLFSEAGIQPVETGTLRTGGDCMQSSGERDLEWTMLEDDLAGWIPLQEVSRLKLLDRYAWERGERILNVPTYFAWGKV